ncbi:LamG domain-containing protein [Aquiflexum lacus]|uniref:LamG domain-containing protein n=1 Tax=Aquiflexum lacus TaxID=2483805 RepID=UPI001893B733|nr:LamG domain-containing protein [Aquiflexum lacus]
MKTKKRICIQSYLVVLFTLGLMFSCEQFAPMEEPVLLLEEFQDLTGIELEQENDPLNARLIYASDCKSDCIELGSGKYFAKKDSKSKSSGINTKKISYKVFNTEEKFVVKVRYDITSGPSKAKANIHVQINGKSKEFKNVPSGYTATFSIPLEKDWKGCDEVSFSILQKGLGSPISFTETYPLIPVCKYEKGLVLWNELGSDYEVLNSKFGPNLSFFDENNGLDIPANREYVPGKFGNAVTIAPGDYFPLARVHNLVLKNIDEILNPERGTISVWYSQRTNPIGYKFDTYRIFDGPYGFRSGISLSSYDGTFFGDKKTNVFSFALGREPSQVIIKFYPIEQTKDWIHIAAVWDRKGISGSKEAMQLYINGKKVAATTSNNWSSSFGDPFWNNMVDIAGANGSPEGKFLLDDLKIYNYAKTDF